MPIKLQAAVDNLFCDAQLRILIQGFVVSGGVGGRGVWRGGAMDLNDEAHGSGLYAFLSCDSKLVLCCESQLAHAS